MPHSWIRITPTANIPLREGRAVIVGDRELAIFNLGDRFLAIDNRCPHQGGPLCDGIVAGQSVVCPLHAWKVNLPSGGVDRPAQTGRCVRTYRTRVEDGVILIAMPAPTHPADTSGEGGSASTTHAPEPPLSRRTGRRGGAEVTR